MTVIGAAATTVFDLELDMDVHSASLAGSRETAATAGGQRRLGLGDEVTFRARHFGLWWRMTSRVTVYERPWRFVDEQTRGPFREMRHEHLFEELGDGRTRMTDRMSFRAPMAVVLTPYLRRLLIERAAHIKARAERRP
ncbi:SRPBCC family protein [Paractinoplanes atraurantiacus]|uniref:SRPBCC family protein n=1 Tax=Paractinoplanes atraurantiacus TaxID=1036182 RepID=UPI001FEBADEF|nr:SRPBCC family protein [Actinoplanes atraurantiacus]